MRRSLPWLWLLSMLLTPAPAALAGDSCSDFAPLGEGEPQLPPGFDNVSWGMSGAAVQAIRAQVMERQPDLHHPEVYYLYESFDDDSSTVRVRYTFFRERLMEVLRYLDPQLIQTPESLLLARFEEHLGAHDDRQTFRSESDETVATAGITQRVWLWCDRFTEAVLYRMLDEGEVRVRCSSRVYKQQLYDELTDQADRAMWESLNGLQIR